MIKIKRIYDTPDKNDGYRILVDRLWPRGMTKEKASVDLWLKEIAPSHELRKWFHEDTSRWEEFRSKYFAELKENEESTSQLKDVARANESVTLLYASRDQNFNHALLLAEMFQK